MCKVIDFLAYKQGKEESEKYIDFEYLENLNLDDFEDISDEDFDLLF